MGILLTTNNGSFYVSILYLKLAPYLSKYCSIKENSGDVSDEDDDFKRNFERYLYCVDQHSATELLLPYLGQDQDLLNIFVERNLFDADLVLDLLKKGEQIGSVVSSLMADKDQYTKEDLAKMHEIRKILQGLPDQGRVETTKGIFGTKVVYACPQGHTNDSDIVYCNACGQDIKGLTAEQDSVIEIFSQKVEILDKLINN